MEIVISNVSVSYGKKDNRVPVLEGINVLLLNKKFNVILGPSGCGKTTLLKAVMGIIDYDGEILFDGISSKELTLAEKNLSYISQDIVLYPHMTIFDNIAFPLKSIKASRDEIIERVYDIAAKLELTDCLSRKPKHLSGGQQQKVAFARALVKKPNICLFDEPFSNLDIPTRTEARHFLKKLLNEMGITVIYVTHDLEEAMSLADKIIILKDKGVEFDGSSEELLESNNELLDYLHEDIH